jgi:Asp-tRNA(Asn)/Glu-tRNA(Gln) amidotransferase A subunit family amidase
MTETDTACMGAARAASEAIDRHERNVHAWTYIDREALRIGATHGSGPLAGVVVGVKDIIDTADMPTEYGSPIYRGHRPTDDASVVALLKSGGALLAGKTVTAEFAFLGSGPTRNPRRLTHTPGGSSMGSAAAVAAGMADAALGTQTAGSIIRPASYCGVIGFKPSIGAVPSAGVKPVSSSCDTVGWFVRDVALLTPLWEALTGRSACATTKPLQFALLRTPDWNVANAHSRAIVTEATLALARRGDAINDITGHTLFTNVSAAQHNIMMYEARQSLAWEYANHADQLGQPSRRALDSAQSITANSYTESHRVIDDARDNIEDWFGDADILLTPAVIGEAPAGLASTGDPVFARPWTALGVPTAAVPWSTGPNELPISVQAVARPGQDAALITAANTLAAASPYLNNPDRDRHLDKR